MSPCTHVLLSVSSGTPLERKAEDALWKGSHFEFDIVPNPKVRGPWSKAQVFSWQRWPSGVVPYVIEGSFGE